MNVRSGLYVMKMRKIVSSERWTYDGMLLTRREGRRSSLTRTGTDVIAIPLRPAWMIVSIVYV